MITQQNIEYKLNQLFITKSHDDIADMIGINRGSFSSKIKNFSFAQMEIIKIEKLEFTFPASSIRCKNLSNRYKK